MTAYTASVSQVSGRKGWSIIFRHPVRTDDLTGKPGKRVHRGLDTRDRLEANRLVDEMNAILADQQYWNVAARELAAQRFDPRVVDIFFDKMAPEEIDSALIREQSIRLPDSAHDDYRRVLLLGTTGAGKTTVVRQVLGTNPATERFPSTSVSRTTVSDTEIVICEGSFRAAVTFFSRDEVRERLDECISAAALAAHRGADDAEIVRRLLSNADQRFRFNYVLGNGGAPILPDDEEDEVPLDLEPEDLGQIDFSATGQVLASAVTAIRAAVPQIVARLSTTVGGTEADQVVLNELFEENLDHLLREDEATAEVADHLMDEIEARFDLLPDKSLRKTRQGWPLSWSFESEDRREFLRAVLRFSSNYAPLFGRLLSPLVNGIRVAGPFQPAWHTGPVPRLVLLDGEGLGHTPDSAAAVSTKTRRHFHSVDAILLVDSASSVMQAAPTEALKTIAAAGQAGKLIYCFTNYDRLKNMDNLPDHASKEQHIIGSVENVLRTIGDELGPFHERILRQRLEDTRFFLGGIDKYLQPAKKADQRTIDQFGKLLAAIEDVVKRPEPTPVRPEYDRMNVVLAVRAAAENYQHRWRALLGIEAHAGFNKEPWPRIKALTRRLAEGWQDEYRELRPVAELVAFLEKRLARVVENPIAWQGTEPSDEEKQQVFSLFEVQITERLNELASRRVRAERITEWQLAYNQSGPGSTFRRASLLADDVYGKAAPVPDSVPSPDRNQFLREVLACVDAAAESVGIKLR